MIWNLEKTIQPKMFKLFIEDHKLEEDIDDFTVNS